MKAIWKAILGWRAGDFVKKFAYYKKDGRKVYAYGRIIQSINIPGKEICEVKWFSIDGFPHLATINTVSEKLLEEWKPRKPEKYENC